MLKVSVLRSGYLVPCVHGREVFCYSGVSYELKSLQIWLHLVELVQYEKKDIFSQITSWFVAKTQKL